MTRTGRPAGQNRSSLWLKGYMMIKAILIGAAVSVMTATAAHAQWQDGDASKNRLEISAAVADASSYRKSVRENPSQGAQSDSLSLGSSRDDSKHVWYSYQTLPRGFSDNGAGLVDSIRTSINFFNNATFEREGRIEKTIPTIGIDVPVLLATVEFSGGGKRHCAAWRTTARGNSTLLVGYYCAAKNGGQVDPSEVETFFKAVSLKN
jgi:hypothetical protein